MLTNAIIQVGIFCALVTAISVPLGLYMARVFAGEPTMLDPVLKPIERTIYRFCGIHRLECDADGAARRRVFYRIVYEIHQGVAQ